MTQPTTRVHLLALMAAVLLTACGDRAPTATPSADRGTGTSDSTGQSSAPLTARTTPLPVGHLAPAFDGLSDGPAVLVFYRGHW